MAYRIRMAGPDDAPQLLDVYAPYVAETCVSFECEVPSVEAYRDRVASIARAYPYLIVESRRDGSEEAPGVVGFAYAHALSERAAYRWSVETSVFLAPGETGVGLGGPLLDALEELLALSGFACAYACITADNAASIAFHERRGYRTCGRFENCAFKDGHWLSVVWMEKNLLPRDATPAEPRQAGRRAAEDVLARANARLAAATGRTGAP